MTNAASERLKTYIGTLSRGRTLPAPDVSPGCAFGVVVNERLRQLEHSINEVKHRLSGLIFVVIGAVMIEIVTRLLG